MKQLLEFENWASNIVHNSIFEKKDDTIKREIPKQQDIVFQAQRKYPDRDVDQALSLFLADKLDDFDKRDLQQNQVINAQRRENEKLKTNFTALQQELDDIETGSAQTDAEVKRLKQLSGQLKTDVETRRVGSDEIRDVLAQVEQLKNKPGMDPKQYEQLKQQVEDFRKTRVDPQKFDEFSKKIDAMSDQERISSENFRELQQSIADLEAKQDSGAELKGSLEQKIQNLNKEQEAETAALQQKIEDLEKRTPIVDMEKIRAVQNKILQKEQELLDISNKINQEKQAWRQDPEAQKYRQRVGKRSKQASTLIKNFLDKEFPEVKKTIQTTDHELQLISKNYGRDIENLKKETRGLRSSLEMMSNAINTMSASGEDIDYLPFNKNKYGQLSVDWDRLMKNNFSSRDQETPSTSSELSETYKMNHLHKKYRNFLMEESPEIGDHTIAYWNMIYQHLSSKYGNNPQKIDNRRHKEIIINVPNLARIFWNNLLRNDQKYDMQEMVGEDTYMIVYSVLGLCTFLVYTFGDRAEQKMKDRTTLYTNILFKAIEDHLENKNNISIFEPSKFDDIKEAANKMVDNIIGEQVARWIK